MGERWSTRLMTENEQVPSEVRQRNRSGRQSSSVWPVTSKPTRRNRPRVVAQIPQPGLVTALGAGALEDMQAERAGVIQPDEVQQAVQMPCFGVAVVEIQKHPEAELVRVAQREVERLLYLGVEQGRGRGAGPTVDEREVTRVGKEPLAGKRFDPARRQRERQTVGDSAAAELHRDATTVVGTIPEEPDAMISFRRSHLHTPDGAIPEEVQGVEQRGFPRAVRPEQHVDGARREVDVRQPTVILDANSVQSHGASPSASRGRFAPLPYHGTPSAPRCMAAQPQCLPGRPPSPTRHPRTSRQASPAVRWRLPPGIAPSARAGGCRTARSPHPPRPRRRTRPRARGHRCSPRPCP